MFWSRECDKRLMSMLRYNFIFSSILTFPLFLYMIMHGNEHKTKEKLNFNQVKIVPQHKHGCSARGVNPTCIYYIATPRAGKMNQILRCDWLPKRASWGNLTCSLADASRRKMACAIDKVCSVNARSKWLDIVLDVFLLVCRPRCNIQPS